MDLRDEAVGHVATLEPDNPAPDEVVRVLAQNIADSRPDARDKMEENWFLAKLDVFERPKRVLDFLQSHTDSITGVRTPTLVAARDAIRRWSNRVLPARVGSDRRSGQAFSATGEIFPEEWIRLVAYRRYEERGRTHGHDREDWFAAKTYLFERFYTLMRRDTWTHELWHSLCDKPLDEALRELAGDAKPTNKVRGPMNPTVRTSEPSPELLERAKCVASPALSLSEDELDEHQGFLVALLLDEPDKGRIIAKARLNPANPRQPRESIEAAIAASPYKARRYQVRQILAIDPAE
jgi:hypothetical protein